MIGLRNCILILVLASGWANGQECPFGTEPSAANLVDFLRQHNPAEENPCIDDALNRLQNIPITDDQIPELIRFLDHRRELNEGEKAGFLLHPLAGGYLYPAISDLFVVGVRATEPLLIAIGTSESAAVRKNALETLQSIYRDDQPKAVKLLRARAMSARGNVEAQRFREAAGKTARMCTPQSQRECMAEMSR